MMSAHGHSEHHVAPLSLYYKVFSTLVFLTLVTVGVSYMGMPPTLSIIVAMIVATIKAFFVCTWFMHLAHDKKFNVLFFLSAFWFIGVFFCFTMFDLASRDRIMKASDSFHYRNERAADFEIPRTKAAPKKH
jgi:cytochrome c oxidase subunit 4